MQGLKAERAGNHEAAVKMLSTFRQMLRGDYDDNKNEDNDETDEA